MCLSANTENSESTCPPLAICGFVDLCHLHPLILIGLEIKAEFVLYVGRLSYVLILR